MTERKNGCHNRAPFVQFLVFTPEQQIPNVFAGQPCKYTLSDLGQADKGCDGCRHRTEAA